MTTPTGIPKVFTVAEVAEILGCGDSTLYRMIGAGTLRSIRVGVGRKSAIRITETALREYIGEGSAA